jgi:preprotein translocase subunit SecE
VSENSSTSDAAPARPRKGEQKLGRGARMTLFVRQMIAELRKVIWPTRKELITYTWVVIVFVTIITAIVGVYDLVFTRLVLQVFG